MQTITVSTRDNHQFELILCPRHEQSMQPLLVCLPAMGVPASKYKTLANAIHRAGLNCAIFEWRGIASSSLRASRRVDFGYYQILQFDLPAAIAALKQIYSDNPIYLVGHSLGGQLGVLYSAMFTGQISGIIGVATGVPYYRQWPFPMSVGLIVFSQLMRLIATIVGHYPGKTLGFAGREARSLIKDWAYSAVTGNYKISGGTPSQQETVSSNQNQYLNPTRAFDAHQLQQQLAQLESRGLMISIEQDTFAPQDSLRHLTQKISNSQVTYVHLQAGDFENASIGHFKWMREPKPVVEKMCQWLQQ